MNQDTARTSARPGAGRALFAAIVGTVIEWCDYALYGTAAGLVIGPLFFAGSSAGASLAAFATFAVGFVARPLGGVLVGHVGDRHGRRPAMMLTVVLMGVATVGTGLLPIHLAIGAAAPVLLVLLRLLQGMGAGAELAGAMTLVAEFAPPRRRGLYTSLVLFAPPAGIVLASVAFLWTAFPGRRRPARLGVARPVPGLGRALRARGVHPRQARGESRVRGGPGPCAAAGAGAQGAAAAPPHQGRARGVLRADRSNALNYILAVFSLSFMTSPTVGMPRGSALLAVSIGSVCGVLTTPLGGLAADRFGARPVLAVGSLLGALGAFPLFRALASGDTVLATVAIGVGYGLVIACTSGAQGAFLAGLFPTAERFSGIALARETNGVVVAGFSPLVAAALITAAGGATWGAATFLAACCLSSVLAVALMRSEHHA